MSLISHIFIQYTRYTWEWGGNLVGSGSSLCILASSSYKILGKVRSSRKSVGRLELSCRRGLVLFIFFVQFYYLYESIMTCITYDSYQRAI